MPSSTYFFTKFASIIYRLGNRYYDRELARHQIGCGQQFFLLRIYENEGISMYDLAKTGYYDKGTVTRAIQKLEELSLIRCQVDEADRRIRHLYTTPAARPIVENLYETRHDRAGGRRSPAAAGENGGERLQLYLWSGGACP